MSIKNVLKRVLTQIRQLNTNASSRPHIPADEPMAEGFTSDFQVRLEWARRKIADYVTEINTTQIVLEEIHDRATKQLRVIRGFEEHVTAKSMHRRRNKQTTAAFPDDEYSALYLAALYASLASDLENDFVRARSNKSYNSRDDCINKSDLIKPLFQETLHVACCYLHAASQYHSQQVDASGSGNKACRDATLVPCTVHVRRDAVEQHMNEYLEVLRIMIEDSFKDGQLTLDLFALSTDVGNVIIEGAASTGDVAATGDDVTSALAQILIPRQFKDMIDKRYLHFERFYLPPGALLFTMADEHLPPAFNVQLAVSSVLDLVSARAHTSRHMARGHHYVLDNAECMHNQGRNDPALNRDIMMIMEHYSHNRVKSFYSECYWVLSKRAATAHKRFWERCGCTEPLHVNVTTA